MIINSENLRDALIAAVIGGAIALVLNGCATIPPPPAPTAAQLAPQPAPTPAPRITGAMILAEQPGEVQQAVKAHAASGEWPTFHRDRQLMVAFTEEMDAVAITCAPLHITDVKPQPGETITSVGLGDSARWLTNPAASGNPTNPTPHVLIKPEMEGLTTNASIFTDRHTYRLALRSAAHPLDELSFYYPEELLEQMRAADTAPVETKAADPIAPTVDPSRLNFAYKVSGPHLTWTPVKVFDDGTRTWIEMPPTTSPITPALMGDGGTMLPYRVRGSYYVVDSLFSKAELISGVGRDQDRVTISRSEQ